MHLALASVWEQNLHDPLWNEDKSDVINGGGQWTSAKTGRGAKVCARIAGTSERPSADGSALAPISSKIVGATSNNETGVVTRDGWIPGAAIISGTRSTSS